MKDMPGHNRPMPRSCSRGAGGNRWSPVARHSSSRRLLSRPRYKKVGAAVFTESQARLQSTHLISTCCKHGSQTAFVPRMASGLSKHRTDPSGNLPSYDREAVHPWELPEELLEGCGVRRSAPEPDHLERSPRTSAPGHHRRRILPNCQTQQCQARYPDTRFGCETVLDRFSHRQKGDLLLPRRRLRLAMLSRALVVPRGPPKRIGKEPGREHLHRGLHTRSRAAVPWSIEAGGRDARLSSGNAKAKAWRCEYGPGHCNKTGLTRCQISIGGDSAGGNLALAVISHLLHPHPQVATDLSKHMTEPFGATVLISPWCQFLPHGGSADTNINSDYVTPYSAHRWSNAFHGELSERWL